MWQPGIRAPWSAGMMAATARAVVRRSPPASRRSWRRWGLTLGVVLLAACSRSETPVGQIPVSAPAPRADNSTAESTLRTYWQLLDWYGGRFVVGRVKPDPEGAAALRAALAPLVDASVERSFSERPPSGRRFKGAIVSVAPVPGSEPQAVEVRAELKSLEKAEATLTPTPVELFAGESFGGAMRYRLVHHADGWRIVEVWRVDPNTTPRRLR
ncbi:MAG: hypothetical protein QM674_01455 [Burkholderiaceae bacterium]